VVGIAEHISDSEPDSRIAFYDGQRFLGDIVRIGDVYEAIDFADQSIGIFESILEARNALRGAGRVPSRKPLR
jgi:hypothetical protein